jgi:hypothetical protein
MPYSAEISRTNPTCFLFLIDQSKSMLGPIGRAAGGASSAPDDGNGPARRKADVVAESVNHLIYSLVLRCVWGQAVLDRFYIGVIGYGRQVVSGLGGALARRDLVPISEVARTPLRVEQRSNLVDDGRGGQVEQVVKFPVWFEPQGDGKTPMTASLQKAEMVLAGFLAEHPACFPPIVINITDGEATDGDPGPSAERMRKLNSEDGEALLFNVHVSSKAEKPIEFPDEESALPDAFARRLFRMSSLLPEPMHGPARQAGYSVTDATRGFVFNADVGSVVRFLDIGTRVDFKNVR